MVGLCAVGMGGVFCCDAIGCCGGVVGPGLVGCGICCVF